MRASLLTAVLTCAPAVLAAQAVGGSASASATSQANVSVPAGYSAEAQGKIDASFQAARAKNLPDQSMRQRIAEGQAKGASEAQVVTAVQRTEARLEASQSAMIRAGRAQPRQEEVASGEQAMARGATEAQIEAFVKHAPADRSLAVALTVVANLEASGQPIGQALAQVTSKLDAQASDDVLLSLAGGAAGAGNSAGGGAAGTGSAAAGVNAATGAAAGAAKGAAGVTGAVTGAVSGVVGPKKP